MGLLLRMIDFVEALNTLVWYLQHRHIDIPATVCAHGGSGSRERIKYGGLARPSKSYNA